MTQSLKRPIKRREPIRPLDTINVPQAEAAQENLADLPPSPPPKAEFTTPKRKRTVDVGEIEVKMIKLEPISEFQGGEEQHIGLLTPASTPTVYSLAKSVFQRGTMERGIIGRNEERMTINQFLYPLVESGSRGALYISGVPGTGKSALLGEVLENLVQERKDIDIRVANINCMVIDRAELIFSRILHELSGREEPVSAAQSAIAPEIVEQKIHELDNLFLDRDSKTRHVVVLDELDHVVTKDQEVLFKIFQWAFMKESNLILVGIANALDLTDRFLPRLRANNLTPQILAFMPYTADQITTIVETKLRSLVSDDAESIPLMHPAAIQLCARKTAANTGDLRKAFDICKRAIEVVEEEVRRKFDSQGSNEGETADGLGTWKQAIIRGSKTFALTNMSIQQAPKVTVAHVARICSTAFGGSTVNRVKALNLQAKAVLCTLVMEERSLVTSASNMTIMKLFDKYGQVCSRERVLGSLQLNEFLEIISALEFAGVINISGVCGRKGLGSANGKRRTSRGGGGAGAGRTSLGGRDEYGQRRIVSNVHLMDLITAVSDIGLLRKFLE